ncbi:MAG: hypothetical protein QXI32_00970 [Candidatus Bathyarchaeia archaeon]
MIYLKQQRKDIVIHAILMICYLIGATFRQPELISLLFRTAILPISIYFLGYAIRTTLKNQFPISEKTLPSIIATDVYLSISCFLLISLFLSAIKRLNQTNLTVVLITITVACILVKHRLGHYDQDGRVEITKRSKITNSVYTIIIIFFGLSIAVAFRSGFSWPSMPGWDVYVHIGMSKWILDNEGLPHGIPFTMHIPPYPLIFHLLIASISMLLEIDPYIIYFYAPFISIPIYGLLVFYMSLHFTEDRWQSFAAALMAITICGGEVLLGPHYFFPSTFWVLMFLLLVLVLEKQNRHKSGILTTSIFFVICYSIYYLPLVTAFPIIVYYVLIRNISKIHLNIIYLACTSVMIPISWVCSSLISTSMYSINSKIGILRQAYPDLMLMFILIGILIVLVQLVDLRQLKPIHYLLPYIASLLSIYFLPQSSSIRIETALRSYLAIICSIPFRCIRDLFYKPGRVVVFIRKQKLIQIVIRQSRWIPNILLICIIVLFSQPYLVYASIVPYMSNISEDEYLAAQWLREVSPANSYILTDPSTGWIFRGLALRNCSTAFIVDGSMPSPMYGPGANLSKLIHSFFKEEDPARAISYLDMFSNLPVYVVITTRTVAWASQESADAMFCAPVDLKIKYFSGMDKFSSSFFTNPIRWKTVIIYKIANTTNCCIDCIALSST